jgi:alkanesulfonate monooxygenase SsuD/methylene tetrahydromethanopterin reductase-like flavin-dependent oxidoreductase (luciferase family)
VQVMRMLWSGGGSFAGRYYRLTAAPGHPRPVQEGGPPILVGGHGERLILRAVARQADLCNIGFDLAPADWERVRVRLDAYAREAGRDPTTLALSHNATVLIGRDDADIERQLMAWAAARGLTAEEARTRLATACAGTPDQVVARLLGLRRAGVTWVFLLFQDLPSMDSLRLFAETVLPGFRK